MLTECRVTPDNSNKTLFTWGHPNKIKGLFKDGYEHYSVFNDQNQFAFAAFKVRPEFDVYPKNKKFVALIKNLSSSLGSLSAARLREISQASSDFGKHALAVIENHWVGLNADTKKFKPQDSANRRIAQLAVRALAYELIYPGFIDDLVLEQKQLLKNLRAQLKKAEDERTIDALEGRLLGIQRAIEPYTKADLKHTNVTYGPAVYFFDGPHKGLSHFYGSGFIGAKCHLPDEAIITDLVAVEPDLLANGFYVTERINTEAENFTRKGTFPIGHNHFADPVVFRAASQGKLIKVDNIYFDVGALDYTEPRVCDYITLDDFKECASVFSLIEDSRFIDGHESGSLFDFLVYDEDADGEDNKLSSFKTRVLACGNEYLNKPDTDDSKTHGLKQLCSVFKLSDYRDTDLVKKEPDFFDTIRQKFCP